MNHPAVFIVVSVLLAILVRMFWRTLVNLLLICCLAAIFTGLLFAIVGVLSILPPA